MPEASKSGPPIDFPSSVGVFWANDHWPTTEVQAIAREIEDMGFGSFFYPESGAKDSVTLAAALLPATDRLVVGTGIINIFARHASIAEAGARTLSGVYPGRFVLGLGVSHSVGLERRFGMTVSKPLSAMRGYLEEMASLPEFVESATGRSPRLLAALGPKMIALSGESADGAMPYLVTPEQTSSTRAILGDDKWIVTEHAVAFEGSADDIDAAAGRHLDGYLRFPNYRNSWLRQGFTEDDLVPGGSDRLKRALIGIGTVDAAVGAVRSQLDAGADHVVVQVAGDGPLHDPRPSLRRLAEALELDRA
jgi:probable F420-dependent oxidoreductase